MAALPLSAGSATIRQSTAISSVALTGACGCCSTFDQSRCPGTARSRLNANIIRDALVMPEPAQKNWPIVAITMTILNAASRQRRGEDAHHVAGAVRVVGR